MNPLALLFVLPALAPAFQDALSHRAPKETVLPDETVVLPLDLSLGWPVVEVGIGERGPYRMIVDTGASVTVLESHMKQELELEPIGQTRIGDPSNPTANEVDIVQLTYLRLGDAYFEDLEAIAWERDMGLTRAGIDGIVGLPVFEDCLVTFDYAARELRIRAGELPPADGRRVLDFERGGHVNLPLEVGGETIEAHLDSGNSRDVVLPGRLEEELALVPGSKTAGQGMRASGPVDFTGGTLEGDVRIGGLVLERPRVAFDDSLPFANLGRSFFEQGTVTLDLANGRIELGGVPQAAVKAVAQEETPPGEGPGVRRVDMSEGRRKLGIEMTLGAGPDLRVGRVIPGSLAESCGLQAGDVLRKVDGTAVSPANTTPLSAVLSTPAAFEIEVERAGEKVVIAVPGKDDASPEALLDRLLGSYTIEARMWRDPGTQPRSFSGGASFERAHEGRFVRESFTLNAGGRELSGDAYLAWRPEAKRFELTQIDAFSPTTFWLTGAWDAERERLAFRSVPASRIPPREDELRWEYRFEEDGVFVKEMLGPDANGDFYVKSDYRYVPRDDSAGER